MAIIAHWTAEQRASWDEWVKAQPTQILQDLARRFPPYCLYRMKSTRHRVTIKGYSDNRTLIVGVSGTYNAVMFNRIVHGVTPIDLEECDLPSPSEHLGATLTTEAEIAAYLKAEESLNHARH